MTDIPDEIMAKARDALAADTKFRTKVSQLAAIFLRHDRELAIAAALLSERTASEAALKEAREVIAKFADMIDGWVRPDPAVVGEAFVQLYDRCDQARAFLAKTAGA